VKPLTLVWVIVAGYFILKALSTLEKDVHEKFSVMGR